MKVAIAGYGVEGKVNYQYWQSRGADITILDEREQVDDLPGDATARLGSGAFDDLAEFDMVVRTAGLAPSKLGGATKIWSATNEFFEHCPAPIIGVTGTKGKGTVSSWIASILKAAGRNVHLLGNIGTPALEVLPQIQPSDLVVFEMSSFQLWDLEASPHVAVVLMIEPDHLDVHTDMADYVAAKTNIAARQTADDVIVYHAHNQLSCRVAEASAAGVRLEYPHNLGYLADNVKLPGRHNLENASAAVAAARVYVDDDAVIACGLAAFTGLPHRLHLVATVDNVRYYDDSIATTPGSAIAAIEAFSEPKVIILGGHDKGGDIRSIIERCRQTDTQVVAIGVDADHVMRLCDELEVTVVREAGAMPAVVAQARQLAVPGGVVILSPAHASFDQYRSYTDRGEQFVEAVQALI